MFKDKLKKLMKEKEINKSVLARLCRVSPQMVFYWTEGIYTPKQDNIYKIAKALEVKPSYLLGFNDEILITQNYNIPFINDNSTFGVDKNIKADFVLKLTVDYKEFNLEKDDICIFKICKPSKNDIILVKENENLLLKKIENETEILGVLKGYFRML